MTYLVTGGAGFIGSHVAGALIRKGARVRILDNLSTGSRESLEEIGKSFELIEADLNDGDAVQRACRGVRVVFHLAALPSVPRSVQFPQTTHQANVNATVNLLSAARAAGVKRIVYSASSSAYGNQGPARGRPVPKREDMTPRPMSPYAAAKLAGELYMQAFASVYDLETVCLRYFNIFGPRQSPDSAYAAAVPRFGAAMLQGRSPVVYGDGRQSRDFTYVANAVTANLSAARAPAKRVSGEVFNVGCGQSATLLEEIRLINRSLGTRVSPRFEPSRVGDVRHSKADVSKARRHLGYKVHTSLEAGIEPTLDWLRQHLDL